MFAPWNMSGVMAPNMGGLLGQDDQSYLRNQGLLGLGASLLAASGPSPTRTSFGQALGSGLLNMQQMQSQAGNQLLQNKMIKAKLDEVELEKERQKKFAGLLGTPQMVEPMGPPTAEGQYGASVTPGSGLLGGVASGDQNAMNQFNTGLLALGGDYTKMGLKGMGVGADTPSSVQEYKYYQSLTPAQREEYLRVKRSQQFLNLGDRFGAPSPTDPTKVTPVAPINLKPGDRPDVKAAQTAATEGAKALVEGQSSLGGALDDINKMRTNIKGLMEDPGFDTIYGASGRFDPRNYMPGTDAANAAARRTQLESQSFGITIQKMRGLGQLSDAEGKKVTAAYTRATNPNLGDKAAREAWNEVLGYLDLAEQRAKEKAGKAGGSNEDPLGLRQ